MTKDSVEDVANRLIRAQIHRWPVTEIGTGKRVGIIGSLDRVRTITTDERVSVSRTSSMAGVGDAYDFVP